MIQIGQVAASDTAADLVSIPAGPAEVMISNAGGGTAYICVSGTDGAITDGTPLLAGQSLPIHQHPGSAAVTLSVLCNTSDTATVGYVLTA